MSDVGLKLRELRVKAGISLRKAASLTGIDIAVLSKLERGKRRLNKAMIIKLAKLYKVEVDDLLIMFLGEKVLYNLKDEQMAEKALSVAEKSIQYGKLLKHDLNEILPKCRSVIQNDNRIEKAWLFGSYARRDQKPGSDLDIMISIKDGETFSLYDMAEIQYQLENLFGIKVDVVEKDALSPLTLESILAEMIVIYE